MANVPDVCLRMIDSIEGKLKENWRLGDVSAGGGGWEMRFLKGCGWNGVWWVYGVGKWEDGSIGKEMGGLEVVGCGSMILFQNKGMDRD